MCQSLFSNRPATFWKKRLRHSCFCMDFEKFLIKLFTEHLQTTASEYHNIMSRGFKAKCEKDESNNILITYLYISVDSGYTCLNYNNSIHQTAYQVISILLYWLEFRCVFIVFASSEFTLRSIDSKDVLAWL